MYPALWAALEPAEGVGRSLRELTEFSAKTRDARGIRNEHDSAKFAGNFVARTSEAFPSFLHK